MLYNYMYHSPGEDGMDRSIKISEARKALFDLVDRVTRSEAEVVWIEHRDREEQAALVSARHLRSLYARIEALQRRTKPFRLAGSMRLTGGAEEFGAALDGLREEQARAALDRFGEP